MFQVFAVVMVFGTGMLGIIAFSPIGKAIADRLRHKDGASLPSEELDDMRAHLQGMQEQLSELAERQDFSERLLAQAKEKGTLSGGPPA